MTTALIVVPLVVYALVIFEEFNRGSRALDRIARLLESEAAIRERERQERDRLADELSGRRERGAGPTRPRPCA